ncbi:hypothetical protein BX666DRAFT_2146040 [Dichotomocladium elegans]|nr:hypothetical protein BX666DRAFT_2146040 [Dichotomocladium elegans]
MFTAATRFSTTRYLPHTRCLGTATAVTGQRALATSAVALDNGNGFAPIPDRGMLTIEGPDTAKFLQGLITNHMPLIAKGGEGLFTAFLTPQGRMLYDAFIYPVNEADGFPQPKYVIECASSATTSLLKHLKRYILRSKVKIRDASEEYTLWNIWGDTLAARVASESKPLCNIGCMDPRVPGFGYRAVLPRDKEISTLLSSSVGHFEELSASEYTIRRILHGIPEGPLDMLPEHSLPLESNFDYMNGVNFNKGCYLGQELTIRTHHTGVVRKRIVPVQLYGPEEKRNLTYSSAPTTLSVDRSVDFWTSPLVPQMDVKLADGKTKRAVGKLGSGIHNIGLALMRLEHVEACAAGEDIKFNIPSADIQLRPFLPEWWPKEQ